VIVPATEVSVVRYLSVLVGLGKSLTNPVLGVASAVQQPAHLTRPESLGLHCRERSDAGSLRSQSPDCSMEGIHRSHLRDRRIAESAGCQTGRAIGVMARWKEHVALAVTREFAKGSVASEVQVGE
jgi:hypothetical protein